MSALVPRSAGFPELDASNTFLSAAFFLRPETAALDFKARFKLAAAWPDIRLGQPSAQRALDQPVQDVIRPLLITIVFETHIFHNLLPLPDDWPITMPRSSIDKFMFFRHFVS